jgi:hypothetical protein
MSWALFWRLSLRGGNLMSTGRNLKAVAADIVGGYVVVNPLYLKPFDNESLKKFYEILLRKQTELRTEPFPYGNVELIRQRNIRLQRVNTAIMIIKNYARDRRLFLV